MNLILDIKRTFLVFCAAVIIVGCQPDVQEHAARSGPTSIRMELIPQERSGIDFNNVLHDDGRLNVFVWNFLYSGAGVAAGDINNDGLPDLFFAGNQVGDRLYLNKGDFVFEDVTTDSGISGQLWSTGVTMADVNGDGHLDIYVCKNSASVRPDLNRNKLYINLGDGRFAEQAAHYGLDDPGFSTQASFFDLDNDGDLDLYLVNQPIDQFAQYVNPPEAVQGYPTTDRLFVNEGGRFVDATARLALENARYGLSVSLGDLDLDGWTDLYICNDYHHGDHLLMNRSGRLVDELASRIGHTSFYSMGSDIADVNNDGWLDCVVLDMAFEDYYRSKTNMESMDPDRFWSLVADGQHYQYAVNTLLLNTGTALFRDVAAMAGIQKTDWSWTPLFADLDNDGFKDLAVTNGIMRDMKNNDFSAYVAERYAGQVGPSNFQEVLQVLPSVPVANKLYRNTGGWQFEDISADAGFDFAGFSQGMAYADFDQDGLLDLAVNNMNAPAGIYRNTTVPAGNHLTVQLTGPGTNVHGLGATVLLYQDSMAQAGTMQASRGYFSSSEPMLHFGLGNSAIVDSIRIIWNDRESSVLRNVEVNQRLVVAYADTEREPYAAREVVDRGFELPFRHQENAFDDYEDQVLLPYQLSQEGPCLAEADVDGDGLNDLYIGGAAGQSGALLLQASPGTFALKQSQALDQSLQFEDVGAVFLDYDLDGDQDLYVASGSNEFAEGDARLLDRMYANDGTGAFTRDYRAIPTALRTNGKSVTAADFDSDGDPDLFVGGRLVSGRYPEPATSAILINDDGRFAFAPADMCPCLENLGLVTSSAATDYDGDGDADLLVVGEWMTPVMLVNEGGTFRCEQIAAAGTGLWWSVDSGDFDGDGDPDYVLGNLGWNNKFGGAEPKLEVLAGDFDKNGDHDVLLAQRSGPRIVPVRGRECSSEEMPFVLDRFPTFDAFGRADLNDLLTEEQRQLATVRARITTFTSVLLRNEGDGTFSAIPLPVLCQTGPIKAFSVADLNGDGHLDFVYAGNHFPTEVETARYDALVHGICLGDGTGYFKAKAVPELDGDYRDLKLIKTGNGLLLVAARNNDQLHAIKLTY